MQSSVDGGDIQNAKEDMFNISNIDEPNVFQENSSIANKSVNLERKAQDLKRFTMMKKQQTETDEEHKQSSTQILNSINEKVKLKSQNSQGKLGPQIIQPNKLKLNPSSSSTKVDMSTAAANQKLLAQLK